MVMRLDKVVPFGRSLDEYRHMFALSDQDTARPILGVGDGPASFNAELSVTNQSVISVDPLYCFEAAAIRRQFYTVLDQIIDQVRASSADWVWRYHQSPAQLRQRRIDALECFIADYEDGKAAGRYRLGELPELEFDNQAFELALCSHLLFLYSEQLSYAFHLASVREMLRVASEIRIFPLLTLMQQPSPYVSPMIEDLQAEGFVTSVVTVDYELQRGGNAMLCISRPN